MGLGEWWDVGVFGYRVSDQELLQAMSQVPIFQVDGKFDYAHAVAVLRAQGRSIPEIEALFRRAAKLRQLDSALVGLLRTARCGS